MVTSTLSRWLGALMLVSAAQGMLAQTPPMGWSSWYAFAEFFNETAVLQTAQVLKQSGGLAAGFEYILLDDGWMHGSRDRYGDLQPDPIKFPRGMKPFVDELHTMGFKVGLYGCVGPFTCGGYPGQFGHEYQDARQLAAWGIDYFKLDNCYEQFQITDLYQAQLQGTPNLKSYELPVRGLSRAELPINYRDIPNFPPFQALKGGALDRPESFELMAEALNASGREILFSACPLIAGCSLELAGWYSRFSQMSMNQCPQIDNNDDFNSTLAHVDDYVATGVHELGEERV